MRIAALFTLFFLVAAPGVYARGKQLADADAVKSPLVSVVDCAQGGQTMARWADPKAACWTEADHR